MSEREVGGPRFEYRPVAPHEPQLFVDDYLVDNRFNEDLLSARVPTCSIHRSARTRRSYLLTTRIRGSGVA